MESLPLFVKCQNWRIQEPKSPCTENCLDGKYDPVCLQYDTSENYTMFRTACFAGCTENYQVGNTTIYKNCGGEIDTQYSEDWCPRQTPCNMSYFVIMIVQTVTGLAGSLFGGPGQMIWVGAIAQEDKAITITSKLKTLTISY